MYNDDDLEAAEKAGIFNKDDIQSFRDFISDRRASPAADEEHFRLLSSFNDIFVSIAILMVLIAFNLTVGAAEIYTWVLVALMSWGLAEHFTRKRRQALPSIILATSFLYAVFETVMLITSPEPEFPAMFFMLADIKNNLSAAIALLSVAVASFWHWRRFKVPISIAYGSVSIAAAALLIAYYVAPIIEDYLGALLFVAGTAIFAFAMRWDSSDTKRTSVRSDVAFWLHLFSAPMLVHPIFIQFLDSDSGALEAMLVVALYGLLVLIALIIDRRAVLVSALAYLLWALGVVIHDYSGSQSGQEFGLIALVIGSVLLLFSALWQNVRAATLSKCPDSVRKLVPKAS